MKRIYLLMILFVAFAATTYAQRSIDLKIEHLNWKTNKLADGGSTKEDTVFFRITNMGPDSVRSNDTMYVNTALTTDWKFWRPSGGLKKDSSFVTYYTFDLGTGGLNPGPNNLNWCDSVYAYAGVGNTAITDPNGATNSEDCDAAVVTMWPASVNSLNTDLQSLALYPNPATSKLSFRYNFKGEAASVVIRDVIGKVVYRNNLQTTATAQEYTLNVTDLKAGIYLVEVMSNNQKLVEKVTIQ